MEVLILDPDAAQEATLAGMRRGCDVEYQAAHFAEEFAPDVVEFVVLLD